MLTEVMKCIGIFILSVALASGAPAQQRAGGDTAATSVNRITIIDPGIALGKPVLLLPPSLQREVDALPPSLFLGEDPTAPPPFLQGVTGQKIDLTSPLRLQMAREEKLKPLWMVLGTVEVGGAAYAAYRYIKKHGLK